MIGVGNMNDALWAVNVKNQNPLCKEVAEYFFVMECVGGG